MAATDKVSGQSGKFRFGATATITNCVHNTGVVTVTANSHGFSVGERIVVESVVGMTDMNTVHVVASAADGNTFTVALTTAQSYTSGGTARRIMAITAWSVDWVSGVIDVTDSSSTTARDKISNGLYTFTGTAEGFLLDGVLTPTKGSAVDITLYAESDITYAGNAIVNSFSVALNVADESAVIVTVGFEGNGTLTESNP